MSTLITGGNGFIGRHLFLHLKSNAPKEAVFTTGMDPLPDSKHHVVCDLSHEAETFRLLERLKPQKIYHLAGGSRVTDTIPLPDYFARNTLTTLHLVRAIQKLRLPVTMVFASSVHVYGNQKGTITEESQPAPITPYGFTKFIAEEALREATVANPQLAVRIARLYNCVGPGQSEGFVTADLCRKIAGLQGKTGEVLRVGPLSSMRQFLDVRDAVNIFPALMNATLPSRYEIFNVSSERIYQIQEVLNELLDIAGKRPQIEGSEDHSANPFLGLVVSVDKLKQNMKGLKHRSLRESLVDMYQSLQGEM